MFCHLTIGEAVKEILKLFGQSSGLHVNYTKSSATPDTMRSRGNIAPGSEPWLPYRGAANHLPGGTACNSQAHGGTAAAHG
jgi:hypothetical protein